jgi:hypothetical protein
MVHDAYFHSIINYDIIFWDNSPYSINIFRLQRKVIRIITSSMTKDSF